MSTLIGLAGRDRHWLRVRVQKHCGNTYCQVLNCRFHTEPLVWNNKPLKLILDHRNGNNSDNRPKNLRLLCRHCDSQLDTRGGGNKGRVQKAEEDLPWFGVTVRGTTYCRLKLVFSIIQAQAKENTANHNLASILHRSHSDNKSGTKCVTGDRW
jgi:HNH endonuclease